MEFDRIFHLDLPKGKIALTWFNSYSGIAIRTPTAILIFDPVKVAEKEHIRADAIVITHEHSDHFDPELVQELQKRTGAVVLTTRFVARRLLCDNVEALTVGDSFVVKGITLYAEHCHHPANQPLSFVVAAEGITIYHPSDSSAFPAMARIRGKYRPQVLLYWGTSLENGVEIAKLVKPQIIVSYDTEAGSSKRLIEAVGKETKEVKTKTIRRFEIYQYPP